MENLWLWLTHQARKRQSSAKERQSVLTHRARRWGGDWPRDCGAVGEEAEGGDQARQRLCHTFQWAGMLAMVKYVILFLRAESKIHPWAEKHDQALWRHLWTRFLAQRHLCSEQVWPHSLWQIFEKTLERQLVSGNHPSPDGILVKLMLIFERKQKRSGLMTWIRSSPNSRTRFDVELFKSKYRVFFGKVWWEKWKVIFLM